MITSITDVAAFVLPVTASLAAIVAAYVAVASRREATPVVVPAHTDLMTGSAWFGGAVKRDAGTTSYDPQSRGSTG